MSDLVDAAIVAWQAWDRAPSSPETSAARVRTMCALAESLDTNAVRLAADVQEARREGMAAPRAIRWAVERARPTTQEHWA